MATQTIQAKRALVLQADEGRVIEDLHVRLLAGEADTAGTLMAATCTNPGPGGPVLHTHHSQDEYYLVLRGRYRFRIDGTDYEGGPGMFVAAPRGTSHTFASVGSEEGEVFMVCVPGGFERSLERMAKLPLDGDTRAGLVALFEEFDTQLDGPPLV